MANLEFCVTHSMVAYLHKIKGSEGFHQIVDFLNTSHIKYALTKNPTIHVSLIQQFWQTAATNTLDSREVQITAIIDGKVKLVSEASIRRHLKLEDSDGITTLPNTKIFEQLTLIGYGKGLTVPVESHHIPLGAPTTSQLPLSSPLRILTRQETKVPQPSFPTYTNVADEVALTSVDVVHRGDATTVSSIDAGQGSGNIPKSPTMPHDSLLLGGYTPGSDEGSMTLHELMVLCTKLSNKVDSLEKELKQTKQTYGAALTKLIKKESLEDTSKQGRMIEDIDQDARISLVTPTKVSSQENQSEESVSTVGASMPVSTAGMVQQVNIIIPSSSETTKTIKDKEELLASETTKDEANPLVADIDWDEVQAQIQANEGLAQKLLEEERENLSIEEKGKTTCRTHGQEKEATKYDRIQDGTLQGKSFYEVKEMFDNVYKHVTSFMPMDFVMEKERTKRAGLNLQEESSKRQKTREGSEPTEELKADEISQEDLQQMIMVVLVEEVYVEALQVKYPIIDWEVYFEATKKYWKIIRVGNHTEAYQTFDDMLKNFDRDDLEKLWSLVKERFSSTDPTEYKERTLWVKLKRLFEPDTDDIMWKLQRYMHDPLTWRLYDTCGVHYVSTDRGHDIFMFG
ncbi:hypothetical protein Tco_0505859 [Tanacetum coccineum]